MQGDRSGQVHPTLRGREGGSGPGAGGAHDGALSGEPALRLSQGVGVAEAGGLLGKQKAGASVVEGGGPEGAREAAKEGASRERGGGDERERVHQAQSRAQGPCVELRLRDG